jgi:hypothetical protein
MIYQFSQFLIAVDNQTIPAQASLLASCTLQVCLVYPPQFLSVPLPSRAGLCN